MKDMEEQVLPVSEIRSRAVTGSTVVVLRGVVVRLISFAGSLILARILTPSDFGLVAVGFTLVAFASFLADGGLGAALIRRPEAPTRLELESLLGFQIALTLIMVGITAALAPIFGRAGIVTLVMVAALPIVTLQAPGAILLERRLRYGPRVLVELTESVAYTGTAIVAVALGAGVWGLAGATVARAAAGAVAMNVVTPVRVLRPRLRFGEISQLLGFGARYQAVGLVSLLRDQGLNLAVATIGGLSALGLWSVAYRVMQLPFVVFEALWRARAGHGEVLRGSRGDAAGTELGSTRGAPPGRHHRGVVASDRGRDPQLAATPRHGRCRGHRPCPMSGDGWDCQSFKCRPMWWPFKRLSGRRDRN